MPRYFAQVPEHSLSPPQLDLVDLVPRVDAVPAPILDAPGLAHPLPQFGQYFPKFPSWSSFLRYSQISRGFNTGLMTTVLGVIDDIYPLNHSAPSSPRDAANYKIGRLRWASTTLHFKS